MTEVEKIQVRKIVQEVISENEKIEFLTIEDVAELLKTSVNSVRKMIHSKGLPMNKKAGCYRITMSELKQWYFKR